MRVVSQPKTAARSNGNCLSAMFRIFGIGSPRIRKHDLLW
jgi:hypothetical protein